MKTFLSTRCKWCGAYGKCDCPHKDRGTRTDVIGGTVVNMTWDGNCVDEEVARQIAAGAIMPPLACDEAELKKGCTE